ncbi:MAG: hypothetical protein COX39_01320 [Candidatus Nealsonbacteria bacterium CG23_combo_of_CG06-09_8_20_14_all_40_13]|uniref:Uncharacterized protein n=1 Tax=Candidatus Nealsonbacteria bacterium CG23_combo_of_CG06-09_8_20_14_all_40_13 TaxID=1974724 RepID=A0A2G9YR69_9BACT|nr:MAG: hypothetical protein COX39_01320 [Candidatus Nealsonbacteria bacterium CG23_combo_of_CG06-09_8_20_14_all_40_13]PIR71138.1 MAG: hypothetical protein COU44_01180 [Candidatus Nealsonbacteria bacterium CG10_big_fil_rev_8_21_14_0_10_40_24]
MMTGQDNLDPQIIQAAIEKVKSDFGVDASYEGRCEFSDPDSKLRILFKCSVTLERSGRKFVVFFSEGKPLSCYESFRKNSSEPSPSTHTALK